MEKHECPHWRSPLRRAAQGAISKVVDRLPRHPAFKALAVVADAMVVYTLHLIDDVRRLTEEAEGDDYET